MLFHLCFSQEHDEHYLTDIKCYPFLNGRLNVANYSRGCLAKMKKRKRKKRKSCKCGFPSIFLDYVNEKSPFRFVSLKGVPLHGTDKSVSKELGYGSIIYAQ